MRFAAAVSLVAVLATTAACSPRTGGSGSPFAPLNTTTVNMASADANLFLQSQTGAAPSAPQESQTRRAAPTQRGGSAGLRGNAERVSLATRRATTTPTAPRPRGQTPATDPTVVAGAPAMDAAGGGGLFGWLGRGDKGGAHAGGATQMAARDGGGAVPRITVRPQREPEMKPAPAVPKGRAKTLTTAFESAYERNPSINLARAGVREADEGVALAKAGNRPTITAGIETGGEFLNSVNTPLSTSGGNLSETRSPTSLTVDVVQPLFQGFRTRNATRQAAANVRAERERLEAATQDTILAVALAFADVRRFRAGAAFRRRDVSFLEQQVAAARSRVEFGEGTQTDVDQTITQLEESRAALADEEAALGDAVARFRQFTGLEPGAIRDDVNPLHLLPGSLADALRAGQNNNPDIKLAIHEVDEAQFAVKTAEGEALPTVTLSGQLRSDIDTSEADRDEVASVRLGVSLPIYQGGSVSAATRQAKEALGGARIAVDVERDNARSVVSSAWSAVAAAKRRLAAADRSVAAARRALDGLLQELAVGQRTTDDILDAQSDLIEAQLTQVTARQSRDAAAFTVLRGMGALTVDMLQLGVTRFDPTEHYVAVRDKWAGFRTPDAR